MSKGELAFVEWLRETCRADASRVPLGIGDDMAAVRLDGSLVLVTSDMLLDGVHFETARHGYPLIGRKAIACSLSDCAAMACRPRGAVISVALNNAMSMDDAKSLYQGCRAAPSRFGCPIIGGDTTSWAHPLAIDVSMLAEPMDAARGPIRRDGAQPGDVLVVTGVLGGSFSGKHLSFTPRLEDAEQLVREFGPFVHAMMDISDGLAIDAYRMCTASKVSAVLDAALIELAACDRAREAAQQDGRSPVEHALSDGEDFELLVAMHSDALPTLKRLDRVPKVVGRVVAVGSGGRPEIRLRQPNGDIAPMEPQGYEHFR